MWCSKRKVRKVVSEMISEMIEEKLKDSPYMNILSYDCEPHDYWYWWQSCRHKINLKDAICALLNYLNLNIYNKTQSEAVYLMPKGRKEGDTK